MKLLKIILCALILIESQMVVDFIYSPFSDSEFASNLTFFVKKNFQDHQFIFNLIYIATIEDIQKISYSPDIIFDVTFSLSLSESIKNLAEEKHVIIASINKPLDFFSDWEFFVHNSWENRVEALHGIISYLNWQTFIVISGEIYNEDDEFFNYFYDKDCQWFSFSNSNDKISADLFVGREIQSTGIKNIVILNHGESTKLLLESLEEHDLLTNGTGIIIGCEGSWNLYGNGIISYVESGLESADCYYCYKGLAFIKFLNLILSFPSTSDPFALLEHLNKNTVRHHPVSNFTLINTKNRQKSITGTILNGNLEILNPLVYPGNSLIAPNSPTTDVNIWIADGTINPGAEPELLATTVTYGEFYALSIWKSMHALDGFEITVTDTDCGVTTYNADYAYSCFYKLLPTPGVGFLTSLYPWITMGYIYTLRALNYSIPHISPYAPSIITENNTAFPEFMTVIKDETFNTQVILNLAVIFGWKNFVVIYDETNIAMYNYFVAKLKEFNMNIVNPPELRKIDTYYTSVNGRKVSLHPPIIPYIPYPPILSVPPCAPLIFIGAHAF
ncbi:unnamed protein product [Blepharisma stoltei]|uniref:Receptor ligand binding region domain-containing protein n=1 Tax=Blepharisma stoltei TaxID=1481888 RepID=A0AAU9JF70_9CILI|nr:unnamed protein product [Blepharisma stoltei]